MKVKLTKGELKRQRDALKQYQRYLPTLQLKKQQLQLEILHQHNLLEEKKRLLAAKKKTAVNWAGLITEQKNSIAGFVAVEQVNSSAKNVAGVDIPVFENTAFKPADYDLFTAPLWLDAAIEALRQIVSLQEEIKVIEEGADVLKHELRITTQRVNLFEKVKIPEAEEAIRLIKIYIGDQMANAVGRSKIAKAKIEENVQEGVLV
ncbi:MAG: V-type ATP synthase subunit D [Candidatus Omnitrophota bacterium]